MGPVARRFCCGAGRNAGQAVIDHDVRVPPLSLQNLAHDLGKARMTSYSRKMKNTATSGKFTAQPGSILKAIRRQRGLTLSQVHSLTGLPISTLSKVENDKLALSYDKLTRLSEGLKVDISHFFGSVDDVQPLDEPKTRVMHGRRSITRRGEGSAIETDDYGYLYPATDLLNKQIIPIVIDVKADSLDEFGEFTRHEGEEYAYVLAGAVDFHTETYAPVRLEEGDSIYFDSAMGHAYVAASKPCRILSICSREPDIAI